MEPRLASRGNRLLAKIVDGLFLGFLPLPGVFSHNESTGPLIAGVLLACGLFVQFYFLTTRGQTIGKIGCGIKIVDAKTKQNAGLVQNVLLRWVFNMLLSAIPLYVLVDPLFVFREDQRCVHDLIAGTVVVVAV